MDDNTGESDDKLLQLHAYREREEVGPNKDGPEAREAFSEHESLGLAGQVSSRAFDLIVEYETGGRVHYERRYKSRAVWPKGSSGVTIGCGYDLGYVDRATFERDWQPLLSALPEAFRSALFACIGLHSGKDSAQTMQRLIASVDDLVVPWDTALDVFTRSTLPKFVRLAAKALPNSAELNGDCFGALVSLTFNRGASYSKAHNPAKDPLDRYREMRAIKALMTHSRFSGVPDQIRAMVRIWEGTDIEKGMRRRRTDEARLFAEGLTAEGLEFAPRGGQERVLDGDEHLVSNKSPTPEGVESWDGPSDEDFWAETSDDELAEAAREEVVPGSTAKGATWAPDWIQPDYAHLDAGLSTGAVFSLKPEDLALLARLNDFNVTALGQDTPVLFGLRGCAIVKDQDNPAGIVLMDQRPDHVTPRCVMGVWDRKAGKLWAFPGSTVPNRKAVATYKQKRTAGNLLPPGLYHYICGPHTTSNQSTPGAFLLRTPDGQKRVVIVRRSIDDLQYDRGDMVHPCAPGDNIHPTFFSNTSGFRSLGCQTVVGTFRDGTHKGPWAKFRLAAGFTDNDGVPGKRYMYMLLTGAEARIAAQLRVDGTTGDAIAERRLRRLRFGSEGSAVERLQQKLLMNDPVHSIGRNTAERLYAFQMDIGNPAGSDGVFSPSMDDKLGWGVFKPI